MNRFTMKKNDTGVPLRVILKDDDGPIDLTGWAVRFVMTPQGSLTRKVDATATVDSDQAANKGQVTYQWGSADVDTVGVYECEFVCTIPGGKQITFPRDVFNNAFNIVEIVAGKL